MTLAERLLPLVEARQLAIQERDELIQQISLMSDDIAAAMAVDGETSIQAGQYLVQLIESLGQQRLDRRRLLELGVTAETIERALIRGKPSTSLRVSHADASR